MEKITDPKPNTAEESGTPKTLSKTFGDRLTRQDYLLELTVIIKKSQNLSNLPPLDRDAILSRANDWFDILHDQIPFESLRISFEDATRNNRSDRLINAFSLLDSYGRIREEEKERKRLEFEHNVRVIEDSRNSLGYQPCEACFDCGFREVTRTFDGVPYKGVIKCYSCNYWERYRQKHGL